MFAVTVGLQPIVYMCGIIFNYLPEIYFMTYLDCLYLTIIVSIASVININPNC